MLHNLECTFKRKIQFINKKKDLSHYLILLIQRLMIVVVEIHQIDIIGYSFFAFDFCLCGKKLINLSFLQSIFKISRHSGQIDI
jgi:hypothetical protein